MTYYCYIYYAGEVPIYVGKGCGRRAFEHLRRCHTTHTPFASKLVALKRAKARITIKLLPCRDEKHAFDAERLLIAWYGRRDLDTGPLLNLTDGGEGTSGMRMSPEARRRISAFHTGRKVSEETRRRMSAASRARPVTEEFRRRCREAALGRRLSPEHRAAISAGLRRNRPSV